MYVPQLACCCLMLGAPLVSLAQTAEPATTPRFYVGLGVFNSVYHQLHLERNYPVAIPVQALVGYQWRPRLAVQLSASYSSDSREYAGSRYNATTGQGYNPYGGHESWGSSSTALLARYTLTRQPTHRLQFDLLGGFTLEHSSYQYQGFHTDSVQKATVQVRDDINYRTNLLLLTVGASVSYRFGQRTQTFFQVAANSELNPLYRYLGSAATSSAALGVRYHFGQR